MELFQNKIVASVPQLSPQSAQAAMGNKCSAPSSAMASTNYRDMKINPVARATNCTQWLVLAVVGALASIVRVYVLVAVQILTVAVLAVVMTAPLGALATSLLGPVLLKKKLTLTSEDDPTQPGEGPQEPEDKLEDVAVSELPVVDGKSGTYEGKSGSVLPCHHSPPCQHSY